MRLMIYNVLINITGNNRNKLRIDPAINIKFAMTILKIISKTNKDLPNELFIIHYPLTAPAAMLSTKNLENIIKKITIGKMVTANPR